jgi:hypothetical protein
MLSSPRIRGPSQQRRQDHGHSFSLAQRRSVLYLRCSTGAWGKAAVKDCNFCWSSPASSLTPSKASHVGTVHMAHTAAVTRASAGRAVKWLMLQDMCEDLCEHGKLEPMQI